MCRMQIIPKENDHCHLHVLLTELLLEIMSHLDPPITLEPCFGRREALIALSETCQRLRHIFRPLIWERIEVCSGLRIRNPPTILKRGHERKKMQDFSTEILRQLRVATVMDPTLSQYVK